MKRIVITTIITTGFTLCISFIGSLPDGRLHIVFCNVGQGDAAYILFPDGRDILVDGGPGKAVLECIGRFMPFWDRHIHMLISTHPQKDHYAGLIDVVQRYNIDQFVSPGIAGTAEFEDLLVFLVGKGVTVRTVQKDHYAGLICSTAL